MSKRTIKAVVPTALILIILSFLYDWHTGLFSPAPLEKITIGTIPGRISGPIFIARAQGYFKAGGLQVSVVTEKSSPETDAALMAGRIVLGCCGSFNLVQEAVSRSSKVASEQLPVITQAAGVTSSLMRAFSEACLRW